MKNSTIFTESQNHSEKTETVSLKSVWELISDSSPSVWLRSNDWWKPSRLPSIHLSNLLHAASLPQSLWNFLLRQNELSFFQCCQVEISVNGLLICPWSTSVFFLPSGDHWLGTRLEWLFDFPSAEDVEASGSALLTELARGVVRLPLISLLPPPPSLPTTYWHFNSVADWPFVSV